jgi:hypothetical protein
MIRKGIKPFSADQGKGVIKMITKNEKIKLFLQCDICNNFSCAVFRDFDLLTERPINLRFSYKGVDQYGKNKTNAYCADFIKDEKAIPHKKKPKANDSNDSLEGKKLHVLDIDKFSEAMFSILDQHDKYIESVKKDQKQKALWILVLQFILFLAIIVK